MRIIPVILSALAFAAAGVGAYFAAGLTVSWIENSSTTPVENRLALPAYACPSVQNDGLKVVLDGEAAYAALRDRAVAPRGPPLDTLRLVSSIPISASAPIRAVHGHD